MEAARPLKKIADHQDDPWRIPDSALDSSDQTSLYAVPDAEVGTGHRGRDIGALGAARVAIAVALGSLLAFASYQQGLLAPDSGSSTSAPIASQTVLSTEQGEDRPVKLSTGQLSAGVSAKQSAAARATATEFWQILTGAAKGEPVDHVSLAKLTDADFLARIRSAENGLPALKPPYDNVIAAWPREAYLNEGRAVVFVLYRNAGLEYEAAVNYLRLENGRWKVEGDDFIAPTPD